MTNLNDNIDITQNDLDEYFALDNKINQRIFEIIDTLRSELKIDNMYDKIINKVRHKATGEDLLYVFLSNTYEKYKTENNYGVDKTFPIELDGKNILLPVQHFYDDAGMKEYYEKLNAITKKDTEQMEKEKAAELKKYRRQRYKELKRELKK